MFKKYLFISLLLIILLTGCTSNKKNVVIKDNKTDEIKEDIIEEPDYEYVDDNPINIGLYDSNYNLVKEYYTARTKYIDLVFATLFTNEEKVNGGYYKSTWLNYKNQYTDIDNYKIGYNVSFYVGDVLISKTITYIEDEYIVSPYFYVYLYDDINQQDGVRYSHLTKDTIQDYNIFTSIKLYLVDPDSITSPITLTAFTYNDEEDFDEDGNYRGNSKYQLTINWLE